jgi:hypothetical protein
MLEGNFDFNRTPMAPPGTKIILHDKPAQRKTWSPHGNNGWSLEPAMEHYRCYRVFSKKTKAEGNTDTIQFFPQRVPMPYKTPTDVAIQASNELIRVLENPTPSTPFAHIGHDQLTAIQTLADIFQNHTSQEKHTSPRVVKPINEPRHTLPRVPTMPVSQHRYPTRQAKSITQHEINTVEEMILPKPTPTIHHWANAIIDPDTEHQWSINI